MRWYRKELDKVPEAAKTPAPPEPEPSPPEPESNEVTGEIETPDAESEYDDLSAKEVVKRLDSGDLDLDWVEEYEEAHKARKTILNWIAENG